MMPTTRAVGRRIVGHLPLRMDPAQTAVGPQDAVTPCVAPGLRPRSRGGTRAGLAVVRHRCARCLVKGWASPRPGRAPRSRTRGGPSGPRRWRCRAPRPRRPKSWAMSSSSSSCCSGAASTRCSVMSSACQTRRSSAAVVRTRSHR